MGYQYRGTIHDLDEPATARTPSTPGPKPSGFLPAKCGTMAGYKQHYRYGVPVCDACKAATAAHSAKYRALKPPTVRVLKPCGTHAAYTRHLNHGEKPCGPCTAAHTAYQAGRRQGTPQERRAA